MHMVPMMVSKLQGLFFPPNQRIEGGGNKESPVSSLPPSHLLSYLQSRTILGDKSCDRREHSTVSI